MNGYRGKDAQKENYDNFDFDTNVNPAFRIRSCDSTAKTSIIEVVGTAMSQDPSRYPLLFLSNGVKTDDVPGLMHYLESGGAILYEHTLHNPIGFNGFMMDAVSPTLSFNHFFMARQISFKGGTWPGAEGALRTHRLLERLRPTSGPCAACDRGGFAESAAERV